MGKYKKGDKQKIRVEIIQLLFLYYCVAGAIKL